MILQRDITQIGTIIKPHGIKGEISVQTDIEPECLADLSCIILDMDGIYVPFFIDTVRPKGASTALITINGIKDGQHAATLAGKDIFAQAVEIDSDDTDSDDRIYVTDMHGYTISTIDGTTIGTVTDIDISTANALFIISTPDGRTVLVPAAEDFMVSLDADAQNLTMDLPDGLIDQQLHS